MLNPFLASSLIFLFLLYQEFHTHLHIGKERMGEGEGKKSEIYMLFNQGLIIFFFCQKCFRDLLGKNTENKILNFKVIWELYQPKQCSTPLEWWHPEIKHYSWMHFLQNFCITIWIMLYFFFIEFQRKLLETVVFLIR